MEYNINKEIIKLAHEAGLNLDWWDYRILEIGMQDTPQTVENVKKKSEEYSRAAEEMLPGIFRAKIYIDESNAELKKQQDRFYQLVDYLKSEQNQFSATFQEHILDSFLILWDDKPIEPEQLIVNIVEKNKEIYDTMKFPLSVEACIACDDSADFAALNKLYHDSKSEMKRVLDKISAEDKPKAKEPIEAETEEQEASESTPQPAQDAQEMTR